MMRNLEHQGLVDSSGKWIGGNSLLVFTGDFTDRGPNGIPVLHKVRELQQQAKAAGGEVIATLGNHDAMMFGLAQELSNMPGLLEKLRSLKLPSTDEMLNDDHKYKEGMTAIQAVVNQAVAEGGAAQVKDWWDKFWFMGSNGLVPNEVIDLATDRELLNWCLDMPAMEYRDGILWQHVNGSVPYQVLAAGRGGRDAAGNYTAGPLPPDMDRNGIKLVNDKVKDILHSGLERSARLFDLLTSSESRAWRVNDNTGRTERAIDDHLRMFAPGARAVAHGHTQQVGEKTVPYANGKAVNLDTGIAYAGNLLDKPGRMHDFTPGLKPGTMMSKPPAEPTKNELPAPPVNPRQMAAAFVANKMPEVSRMMKHLPTDKQQLVLDFLEKSLHKHPNVDTADVDRDPHFDRWVNKKLYPWWKRMEKGTLPKSPPAARQAAQQAKATAPPPANMPQEGSKEWQDWVAQRAYYIYASKSKRGEADAGDTQKIWFQAEKDIKDYITHLTTAGSAHDSSWWKGKPYAEWRRFANCIREAITLSRAVNEVRFVVGV
jgi:hypothetical protein